MKPVDPQVLPLLKPAARPLGTVLVGNTVVALLVVGQAFAVGALVAGLLDDPAGGWQTPGAWLVALSLVRYAVAWLVEAASARAASRVGADLRQRVLQHALDLPATDLSSRSTGSVTALATRGVTAVEPYVTRYLPALVLGVLLPVATVIAIATQDLWSALIVLCTLPLVPVFAVLIGMATQEKADQEWRTLSQLASHFLDVVKGLPTLVAHRRARPQVGKIREVTERYRLASRATLRVAFASSAVLELIATISVALVAVCVGLRLAAGHIELQTALTVLLLAPEAYWPLRRVGAEFHAAAEGTAAFTEVNALLKSRIEVARVGSRGDGSCASAAPDAAPCRPTAPTLEFIDVSLGWPDRSPVQEHLDLTIPGPGVTALVGPSGAGKTTLLQALLGELPLVTGRILVDGHDLSGLDRDLWLRQVAHLPQRPWLTPDTIADNLRIGAARATDEELLTALDRVGLRDAVRALPEGLETTLGEDGAGLSAGQRARLAMARVLLTDRPIVLLDEPSAHLDDTSESLLLDAIAALGRDRTVLVVAHRPAVAVAADHVVRLPGRRTPPQRGTSHRAAQQETLSRRPRRATSAPQERDLDAPGARPRGPILATSRWRWALAVLLGTLAAASGIALTATAGWLIARSAEQPP
ncbi:thiol reductant ABC exporter subunit CydD [Nocardioides alcanivorans]|uniref:thiol reductant ABC exporter subunit CydD n=1 Tax=Nocardioides alcanivorans TaxID=2897352 RepID=UPI001F3CE301|nr:thiol reductant ABC exporter subunit CydD [Nocardioides alcanivorans]